MSFLGGSTNNLPTAPNNPLGVNEYQLTTIQRGVVAPYLAGKRRFAPIWISGPYNTYANAVSSGGGKGGAGTSGYDYYATIAALVCQGPVDAIYAILCNNTLVWGASPPFTTAPLTRSGDYVDISVSGFGGIRLYWGTDTQGIDPTLAASGDAHPAYRGFCYAVFQNWFLGLNQTSFQNVEFVVGKWTSPGSWFTPAVNINDDANPAAVVADWLLNPRAGLGLPAAAVDQTSIVNAGTALVTNAIGLSPLLDSQTDMGQLLTDFLMYFDAFPTISSAGQFGLGLVRAPGSVGSLPTVADADLADKPTFKPDDWTNTYTETHLTYQDRAQAYAQNVVSWRDAGNFSITAQASPQDLQWPHVTSRSVATALVATAGRIASLPALTGQLKLRYSDTLWAALTPGAVFVLNYSQRTLTNLLLRVQDRTMPDPGQPEFEVNFTADRSYLQSAAS